MEYNRMEWLADGADQDTEASSAAPRWRRLVITRRRTGRHPWVWEFP